MRLGQRIDGPVDLLRHSSLDYQPPRRGPVRGPRALPLGRPAYDL